MNTHYTFAAVILYGLIATQSALAGGTTGPCTPPEGKIDIQPSQKCNGKYTVAIGKELTLKAVSLKDKDCYCGRGVQDTINPDTGVRWSVGGGLGTLDGGTDGTPKTYTAPWTTHTDLAVRLQVDDEASAPETYNDGGFIEVSSLNLDVVKPNTGWTYQSAGYTSCGGGNQGRYNTWATGAGRSGCTVDFSLLLINEKGCEFVENNSGMPLGQHGPGADQNLNGYNEHTLSDNVGFCWPTNYTPSVSVTDIISCTWNMKTPSAYLDWGKFKYWITFPSSGGINSLTSSRAWDSAVP